MTPQNSFAIDSMRTRWWTHVDYLGNNVVLTFQLIMLKEISPKEWVNWWNEEMSTLWIRVKEEKCGGPSYRQWVWKLYWSDLHISTNFLCNTFGWKADWQNDGFYYWSECTLARKRIYKKKSLNVDLRKINQLLYTWCKVTKSKRMDNGSSCWTYICCALTVVSVHLVEHKSLGSQTVFFPPPQAEVVYSIRFL